MKTIFQIIGTILVLGIIVIKINSRLNRSATNESNAKQQQEFREIAKTTQTVNNQLTATEWMGITSINNDDYLTEISFTTNALGKRILYLTEAVKEGCLLTQDFQYTLSSGLSRHDKTHSIGLYVSNNSFDAEKCSEVSLAIINAMNDPKFNKLIASKGYQSSDFQLEGFTRKEMQKAQAAGVTPGKQQPPVSEVKIDLTEVKQLRQIEQELVKNFEEKPGGLSKPKFRISGNDHGVTVNIFRKDEPLGNIMLEKDKYYFTTLFWINSSQGYAPSGFWRNISFKDKEGKEKTGDLEFFYREINNGTFWFIEVEK